MTIKDCIDIVDNLKPNQYTIKDKVMWLSFIEEIIINEVLKTHEGYDGRYDDFEGYTEDKLSVTLIVPSPHDRLYTAYLKMKIDEENGEVARYNNSMVMYNSYMTEFRKYYNKTHMPLDPTKSRSVMLPKKVSSGLTDAEYENLVKDMTYILTEYFSKATSPDVIHDIVKSYMQTNAEMFKGKDGKDGINGKDGADGKKGDKGEKGDMPTTDDVLDIDSKNPISNRAVAEAIDGLNGAVVYCSNVITTLESDVGGLFDTINQHAHFKGYFFTIEELRECEATPNDYAYVAETGTKWIYLNDNYRWKNSLENVPNQMTPASGTTPLVNGTASVGEEDAYARGDHRHPTDTTRASVAELNALKADMEAVLDELHNYAQELKSGGGA